MKHFLQILALVCVLMSAVSCANNWNEIRVTSCSLSSISATGIRTMDGVVNLTVDNPAPDFILKNASGHIKHKDKDFLVVSASDLFVEGRSTKEYRVPLRGELAPGLTTLSFLGTIGTSGLSEYTIDINATVSTKSGFKKDIEYKNIPLEEAIKLF